MNRKYFARTRAKAKPVVKKEAPSQSPGTSDGPIPKIQMLDLETKELVEEFESMDAAMAAGYNMPQIKKAVKNNTKYKGHLWAEV